MEESPELISPRISFSHDLVVATPTPAALAGCRTSDASLLAPRARLSAEPEFDFANAVAAAAADDDDDVAPADRLFAGGKLLPMPPLPPAPKPIINNNPCKPLQASCRVLKAQQQQAVCQQQIRRPGSASWASPFSRSSSVNSATTTTTTTTTGAPRSAAGRFGCPPFPLMRSWSVGSAAAVARDGGAAVSDASAGHHRPRHHDHHQYYKKFGGAAAATGNGAGGSRAHYYGGSRKGSGSGGSHGVSRVRPVLNVPLFIGTSVSNMLSYLLCDCSSHRTKKSREF